ncbi:MAG: DNA-binding protein [Candidatus Aenigmarchaeota archaeon]|nr:DNA-binding protein [Candidatus Aenigmarchaeota archaeon]
MRVLLDANFLMIPGQFGVDIFTELERVLQGKHELITLDSVVQELKGLSKGRTKDARAASMALQLIEKKGVRVLHEEGQADEAIVTAAIKGNAIVATQDRTLQDALHKRGVALVTLKGKNRLELEGT